MVKFGSRKENQVYKVLKRAGGLESGAQRKGGRIWALAKRKGQLHIMQLLKLY